MPSPVTPLHPCPVSIPVHGEGSETEILLDPQWALLQPLPASDGGEEEEVLQSVPRDRQSSMDGNQGLGEWLQSLLLCWTGSRTIIPGE